MRLQQLYDGEATAVEAADMGWELRSLARHPEPESEECEQASYRSDTVLKYRLQQCTICDTVYTAMHGDI